MQSVLDTVPGGRLLTIHKGQFDHGYSGFSGVVDKVNNVTSVDPEAPRLAQALTDAGITDVDIVGIATDHCVRATTLDALGAGFRTRVLVDKIVGVDTTSSARALDEMWESGAILSGNAVQNEGDK